MRPYVPLIPVLDVLHGQVVRAVAGRRSQYPPIRSTLTDSCDPADVARAMIAATGAETIYVADLDGIMTGTPSKSLDPLTQLGVRVLLDPGLRSSAEELPDDRFTLVIGTETATGPSAIVPLLLKPRKVVLSVDLFEGRLLGNWSAWGASTDDNAMSLLSTAIEDCGLNEVILLDIARVGIGTGTGTERLLAEAVKRFTTARFLAGGGIRSWDDVHRLTDAGAAGVLVSSAIHAGTIHAPRN